MATTNILTTSLTQQRLKSSKWIEIFLWGLCSLPVLHAGLLLSITDPHSPSAIAIHFLRPIGILGTVFILLVAAFLTQGRRRWTWIFDAMAMLFSIGFSVLRIVWEMPVTAPVMLLLVVLIYSFALIGTAFYLEYRSWWVGSTLRVVMGGITVGYSTLVLMQSVLPVVVPIWHIRANTFLPFIAFDMGILFAIGVVGLRYGLGSRPIIPLTMLSLTCLLIADTMYLFLVLIPGAIQFYWMVMPLYTLHNVLLAFAAYRDATYVSQSAAPVQTSVMPFSEWVLWTFAPLVAVFAAFMATGLLGKVPYPLLIGLLLVAVVHEILAAFDYRRVLQNLQQTNVELAQANSALSKAHEQVQAAAATMEAFVARIIHDLAPPVQGLLSVVRDTSWRDDQRQLQHIVSGQVGLLEAFVHQARAYITARTVTLKQSKLDLLPICLSAVAAARPRAEQRNVRIVQDILVESPTVVGDETAVRRILDNLLTNAVGISPPGGEVALSVTAPTPKQIEISVSDQGPGIPSEKQAQLFKPYTSLQFPSLKDQGRSASPTGTGMGLGLAIVKELSLALGGDCGVTSSSNAGSTFYVRLPVELVASPQVREGELA